MDILLYAKCAGIVPRDYVFRSRDIVSIDINNVISLNNTKIIDMLYNKISKRVDDEDLIDIYNTFSEDEDLPSYIQFINKYKNLISKLQTDNTFITSQIVNKYNDLAGVNVIDNVICDLYNKPIMIGTHKIIYDPSSEEIITDNRVYVEYDIINSVFNISSKYTPYNKSYIKYEDYIKNNNIEKLINSTVNGSDPVPNYNDTQWPLFIAGNNIETSFIIVNISVIPDEDRSMLFTNNSFLQYFVDYLCDEPKYALYKMFDSNVYIFYKINEDGTLDITDDTDNTFNIDEPDLNQNGTNGNIDVDMDLGFLNDNDLGVKFDDVLPGATNSSSKKLSSNKKKQESNELSEMFRLIFTFCLAPLNLLFELVFAIILSLLEVIVATVKYALKLSGQTLCTWATKIFDFMIDGVKSVLNLFLTNIIEPVQSFLSSTFGGVINTVVASIDAIYVGIQHAVTELTNTLYTIFTGIENVFHSMHDVVSNVINKAENEITGYVEKLKNTTSDVLTNADTQNTAIDTKIAIPNTEVDTNKSDAVIGSITQASDMDTVHTNISTLSNLNNKVTSDSNSIPNISSLQGIASSLMNILEGGLSTLTKIAPYVLIGLMFVGIVYVTKRLNSYIITRVSI